MKKTYLRAAALLTLSLSLLAPASATSVPTTDEVRVAFTARPAVKAKITLSPVGDKLTGAKIPIKGYLSGNSEQARKVITLQQKIKGKWRTKATKKRKANGAYSLKAQVVTAPRTVKYRTTVSYKGRMLDKSKVVLVKVVRDPNAETSTDPTDTTPPAAPTGVTAVAGNGQVALKWNAVSDAASYTVYWSLPGQRATEASTTSTSRTITGLANGTEYYFSLRAVDKAGNKSVKSVVVSATPFAGTTPPPPPADTTPPAVPTGLAATAGDGQVVLTWNAVSATDLAGYRVSWGRAGSASVVDVSTTTHTVTGLTNGLEYYFMVQAFDTTGNASAKSAEAAATPASATPPPPAPMTEQRTIDGEKRCHILEVQTFNQERTNSWQWDGDSWEPNWSEWTTTSEGVRAASASDCLDIVESVPADALLPDVRMRNLDKCSPAEVARDTDTVQDCFRVVYPAPGEELEGKKLLKFPIITLNVGEGPSEIIVDRSATTATDWKAYQTFYDAEGNRESVLKPAAEFYYASDGHNHWHIRDFDSYMILDESGTEVRLAEKHGYCLEDNTSYTPMQGAPGVSSTPVYEHSKMCGLGLPNALTIVHGVSRGWGDTYPSTLPDQAIDITGLPDGTYTVQVTADDKGVVTESSDTNNTASMKVTIVGDTATAVLGSATGGL